MSYVVMFNKVVKLWLFLMAATTINKLTEDSVSLFYWKLIFNSSNITSQNGQRHFENLSGFAATILIWILPFGDAMH